MNPASRDFEWDERVLEYHIDLSNTSNAAGWRSLTEVLSAYYIRDSVPALAAGTTNENGVVTFSPLDAGLYLVIGDSYVTETERIFPVPFIAAVS